MKQDFLIQNLIGTCAYNRLSQDVPCWQSERARANYCTPCEAAERLKAVAASRPRPQEGQPLHCFLCQKPAGQPGPLLCDDDQVTAICGPCAVKAAKFLEPGAASPPPQEPDNERRKKALKLLEAITEECEVMTDGDHVWRKCRACLARFELEQKAPRSLLFSLLVELRAGRSRPPADPDRQK